MLNNQLICSYITRNVLVYNQWKWVRITSVKNVFKKLVHISEGDKYTFILVFIHFDANLRHSVRIYNNHSIQRQIQ